MPQYYNPYNMIYPASYQPVVGQASFAPYNNQPQMPAPVQNTPKVMEWVEGEIGAIAFQMPNGLAPNTAIPLWDSKDTNIYLKSWNQMGMANPIQKLHYTIEDEHIPVLPGNTNQQSGSMSGNDMSQYVTKTDLEQLKEELQNSISSMSKSYGNQNGSNVSGNQRGVNR